MTNELYKKLTRLQWLLHRQQMQSWALRGPMADTTRGQGRILALLKLRDGISTKDLSYYLGVRISSLNETLMKMEKGGYITREPSEQDKRVMLVKLTEKGRNEEQPRPLDFDDIFSCLSEDEQGSFGEYIDRIAEAIQANFSDGKILEKMETIRGKMGDMGAFFEEQGREFFCGRGFHHGARTGCGYDHNGRNGFSDHHGFSGDSDTDIDNDTDTDTIIDNDIYTDVDVDERPNDQYD